LSTASTRQSTAPASFGPHTTSPADDRPSTPGTTAPTPTHRAALIRDARKTRGYTQADLARLAGYSQPTISRLENGGSRVTDTDVLARLAELLGITPAALGIATSCVDELVDTYRPGTPALGQLLLDLVANARRRIDLMGDFALPQQIHALPRHLTERAACGVTVRVIITAPANATHPVEAARNRAMLDAHTTSPAYPTGIYHGTLSTAIARIDDSLLVRTTIDGHPQSGPVLHLRATPGGTLAAPYLRSIDTVWTATTPALSAARTLTAVA
jgi:transcriptional regulator with XRE-family HTH domain